MIAIPQEAENVSVHEFGGGAADAYLSYRMARKQQGITRNKGGNA
jgi:hypothetical protein